MNMLGFLILGHNKDCQFELILSNTQLLVIIKKNLSDQFIIT